MNKVNSFHLDTYSKTAPFCLFDMVEVSLTNDQINLIEQHAESVAKQSLLQVQVSVTHPVIPVIADLGLGDTGLLECTQSHFEVEEPVLSIKRDSVRWEGRIRGTDEEWHTPWLPLDELKLEQKEVA